MQPEKRMLLSALLLAVAQQVPANVQWLNVRPYRANVIKETISHEARDFVSSEGFDEMCQQINMEPNRLRSLGPEKAFTAYKKITSDDFDKFEVEKELDGLS